VLERRLGPIDDPRFDLPVDFDFDNASAYGLGVDVGAPIDERERQRVTTFLVKAKDEDDRHLTGRTADPERAHLVA
jgi:hypothetical protein